MSHQNIDFYPEVLQEINTNFYLGADKMADFSRDEKNAENPRIKLLKNLRYNTYCRIGLSKISGVGVLAIKAINANVDPFQTVYKLATTSIDISEKEIETLDQGVSTLIKDFFMKTPEGTYPVYFNGLNAMDIAYYLNHSDNPNVLMVYEPKTKNGVETKPDAQEPDPEKEQESDQDPEPDLELEPESVTDSMLDDLPMDDLPEYYTFRTLRSIVPGEELTIDYYQHAKSLREILEIRKQFKLPFPSYALKVKKKF